jgi:L-alanine-DL-glutamate epimerase-like enolase superfamily enzyme
VGAGVENPQVEELYMFRNGEIDVPHGPGLGLDFDEEAIDHYKF